LELNSSYSYILWCDKFADSTIVAVKDNEAIGFVQGFIQEDPEPTLFVLQVAVSEEIREQGLATRMIETLMKRTDAKYLEATVTQSNLESNRLFQHLAVKYHYTNEIQCYLVDEYLFISTYEADYKLYLY